MVRLLLVSGLAAALVACATATEEDPAVGGEDGTPKSEVGSNADVLEAVRALPEAEVVGATDDGVATELRGELAKVGAMQSDERATAEALLRPALVTVLKPFRLTPDDVRLTRVRTDENGERHARYRQVRDGLDVIGGDLVVHVDIKGTIYAVNGTARGDLPSLAGKAELGASAAVARVARDARFLSMDHTGDSRQVYIILPDGAMHKAWEVIFEGERGVDPQRDRVYVSVDSGAIVAIHPQFKYAKNRAVYSANNRTSLPGTLRRSEGGAATNDSAVDLVYANTGSTYDAYDAFWGRDSYNDAGAQLVSTVHYSTNYCNAFWNGTQMVFGDGDASQGCASLAISLDVTAHELTHAVTEYESDLTYSGESGGLNEAMSDIFGAFTEAWALGGGAIPASIPEKVWLIGDEVLPPFLRKMSDPAADAVSLDFWSSSAGNVDVHYNSGIANLAFYLLSQGGQHPRGKCPNVTVAGVGMEKAIRIFYKANTDILTSSSNFAAARAATEQAAEQLYGAATKTQVENAWKSVNVGATPGCTGGGGGTDIPLTSGTPVTGISGSAGDQKYYKLDVPAGQTTLTFTIAGGTGDADLYVRAGERPTTSSYTCRPYLNGNNETCTITSPAAGTYYVMLRAYTSYAGVTLTGTYTTGGGGGGDPYLTNGVPVSGISGASSSNRYWRIAPGSGKTLTVRTSGGSGDVDLYVRAGSRPTTSRYTCRSIGSSNTETCTISNTVAGDYYILLRGWSTY